MMSYITLLLQIMSFFGSTYTEENIDPGQEQITVRAVFINCEPIEEQNVFENQVIRFQREELFKHNALQDCQKKLALTVKIQSEPDESFGDEYIPIEHVFDGPSKRRIRLLNPYILRLRRETPLQAYKLHRIDTVAGVLTKSNNQRTLKKTKNRVQRNLIKKTEQKSDTASDDLEEKEKYANNQQASLTTYKMTNSQIFNQRVKRDTCTLLYNAAWKRDKRHEHNIIIEDITDDYKIPWTEKYPIYQELHQPTKIRGLEKKIGQTSNEKLEYNEVQNKRKPKSKEKYYDNQIKNTKQKNFKNALIFEENAIKNFIMYEIDNPDLWYAVNVQLFEKMSTPEGKTLWNDITRGEVARVSSIQPEWADQDLNVRYKPSDWMSKEDFTLPAVTSLCLLAPIEDKDFISLDAEVVGQSRFGKYIVVPKDDIVSIASDINNPNGNYTDTTTPESIRDEQGHRRVLIRMSRALLTDSIEELTISSVGSDQFLTLPHRRTHHAQIDLEARADENQVIRVGSMGSLITVVTDNLRRTRSVITVLATNKGLAAAKFRVKIRDCGPEMANVLNELNEQIVAGPILVAPRHTQQFRLELPSAISADSIHCSVAMINDDEESIAVRDVTIGRSDRCFCVWHCDCVCLNEDPKLSCREMSVARQAAAGLSIRGRTRQGRSVCYSDCATINMFVIVVGVLIALLLLGLVKACFGLFCRCVAQLGLGMLVQTPRKLDHYFEPALQNRSVVYDEEGWPVHPDTKQRTVRIVSRPMEFILNLTMFITLPCLLLREAVIQLACRSKLRHSDKNAVGRDDKTYFSTHDMQGMQRRWRHRRGGLRQWMSPQAEDLTSDIWTKGLSAMKSDTSEFMQPLLIKRPVDEAPSSCLDSEQDDTEYVLTQMQKSKESLAKMVKKNGSS